MDGEAPKPFWKTKTLSEMSPSEWESLCDGCGRCCLLKLQDEETERVYYTDVSCRLLDCGSCRCKDYENRKAHVPDCVRLTPQEVQDLGWLPLTCGYRLVRDRKDLAWWHPLVSGSPDTVHEAGVSVRGRVFGDETEVPLEEIEDRIVSWPGRWVKRG
ncbi:YcgN family cysteine cluster protein [Hansschlegelia quercus]|uniref:UPF0260 protein EYR15_13725 n=1 Tax=Hansschlegelia quercus TaxID=2528245 RepID=A0A4Q9GF23_9HYPH|nr:YcgN family cysteine cluster protein [Hansschlegelia quercus]TBN48642.1 YcgN family cysteine cluster protein [Hansschlegelia quercus]